VLVAGASACHPAAQRASGHDTVPNVVTTRLVLGATELVAELFKGLVGSS
jgi:hypothetical protein